MREKGSADFLEQISQILSDFIQILTFFPVGHDKTKMVWYL